MRTYAIVPAAGSGARMGADKKKQFFTIGGEPILAHTLRRLSSSPMVEGIILAAPVDERETCEKIVREGRIKKVVKIVDGGITRQESVSNGFYSLPDETNLVLIHDGVRPFVTVRLIEDTIVAAARYGAAVAAIRVKDTLKRIDGGVIIGSLSRDDIARAQTPQCFQREALRQGLTRAERDGFMATDESSLVERLGALVRVVEGEETNIKITTPDDLKMAEALLKMVEKEGR